MICGIYGFGTWGGVRLLSDKSFLKRCSVLGNTFEIECIYKVQVYQGEPAFVTPMDIRHIRSPAAPDGADTTQ